MAKFLSHAQKCSVAVNMMALDNFKSKWDCYRLLPSDPQPCLCPSFKQGPDRPCTTSRGAPVSSLSQAFCEMLLAS